MADGVATWVGDGTAGNGRLVARACVGAGVGMAGSAVAGCWAGVGMAATGVVACCGRGVGEVGSVAVEVAGAMIGGAACPVTAMPRGCVPDGAWGGLDKPPD